MPHTIGHYIRWSLRRLFAALILPILLFIDVSVMLIRIVFPVSQPCAILLSVCAACFLIPAALRALLVHTAEPAAAAAATSGATPVHGDAQLIIDIQICLRLDIISAMHVIVQSACAFLCACGILICVLMMSILNLSPLFVCMMFITASLLMHHA